MKSKNLWRLRLISGLFLIIAIAFGSRLFVLQIVHGEEYSRQADRQYFRSADTFFNRGTIFFSNRNGTLVPAATLNRNYILSINPQLVRDPDSTLNSLKTVIELDWEEFLTLANHPTRVYAKLADVDRETAADISNLGLRGMSIQQEKKRFYPAGRLASHTLGFMAYQDEELAGRYGLEKYYEDTLNHRQLGTFASFFVETFLRPGIGLLSKDKQAEGDLILTIEPVVQDRLEESLSNLINHWQAEGAGAIIMDPATGDIIAMAAKPDFDPGSRQTDINVLANPLTERVFEMGSVVKALTIAAGLDAEVINRHSTYYDAGRVTIDRWTIANHDGRARGTVDMQTFLNQSLNTGAIHIMQQLGPDRFRDYFFNFGLNQPTGIDLPNEIGGLMSNLNSGRAVEYAAASFGQGIALTPLGATRAFAALANNGQLIKPRVVRAVRYRNGDIESIEPVKQNQVISRAAADEVTTMLVAAVDEALLGGQAALPQFAVAAKTGTAQMPRADGPGYDPNRFFHSFFGYYPAYEPRFVAFFYLINPRGVRFASDTLVTPFMDTAKFLLDYYQVPPDR